MSEEHWAPDLKIDKLHTQIERITTERDALVRAQHGFIELIDNYKETINKLKTEIRTLNELGVVNQDVLQRVMADRDEAAVKGCCALCKDRSKATLEGK